MVVSSCSCFFTSRSNCFEYHMQHCVWEEEERGGAEGKGRQTKEMERERRRERESEKKKK